MVAATDDWGRDQGLVVRDIFYRIQGGRSLLNCVDDAYEATSGRISTYPVAVDRFARGRRTLFPIDGNPRRGHTGRLVFLFVMMQTRAWDLMDCKSRSWRVRRVGVRGGLRSPPIPDMAAERTSEELAADLLSDGFRMLAHHVSKPEALQEFENAALFKVAEPDLLTLEALSKQRSGPG